MWLCRRGDDNVLLFCINGRIGVGNDGDLNFLRRDLEVEFMVLEVATDVDVEIELEDLVFDLMVLEVGIDVDEVKDLAEVDEMDLE